MARLFVLLVRTQQTIPRVQTTSIGCGKAMGFPLLVINSPRKKITQNVFRIQVYSPKSKKKFQTQEKQD